jgi:membrane protease YdiL (CAAX protease family)
MTDERRERFPWRLFWILLIAGCVGVAAILPLQFALLETQPGLLQGQPLPLPIPVLVLISILQNAVLLGLIIAVGITLARKVGLGAPLLESWLEGTARKKRLRSTLALAFMAGIGVGLLCLLSLYFFFLARVPVQPLTLAAKFPLWKRFAACFYGGIVEELMTRLFLFSLLVWLLNKVLRGEAGRPRNAVFWIANVIATLVFALGHLPFASMFMQVTPAAMVEALLLNGIAGVTFGYLYWKRGLEAAMLAHFAADLMLVVIGPALLVR